MSSSPETGLNIGNQRKELENAFYKCFHHSTYHTEYLPLSTIVLSNCLMWIIAAISYCSAYSCPSHQYAILNCILKTFLYVSDFPTTPLIP